MPIWRTCEFLSVTLWSFPTHADVTLISHRMVGRRDTCRIECVVERRWVVDVRHVSFLRSPRAYSAVYLVSHVCNTIFCLCYVLSISQAEATALWFILCDKYTRACIYVLVSTLEINPILMVLSLARISLPTIVECPAAQQPVLGLDRMAYRVEMGWIRCSERWTYNLNADIGRPIDARFRKKKNNEGKFRQKRSTTYQTDEERSLRRII